MFAGVVVVCVMIVTTVLVTVVMRVVWNWRVLSVLAISAPLLIMESVYLSAVLYKVCACSRTLAVCSAGQPDLPPPTVSFGGYQLAPK
jgi:K+ transporter